MTKYLQINLYLTIAKYLEERKKNILNYFRSCVLQRFNTTLELV